MKYIVYNIPGDTVDAFSLILLQGPKSGPYISDVGTKALHVVSSTMRAHLRMRGIMPGNAGNALRRIQNPNPACCCALWPRHKSGEEWITQQQLWKTWKSGDGDYHICNRQVGMEFYDGDYVFKFNSFSVLLTNLHVSIPPLNNQ